MCPFELHGICKDKNCTYQHLRDLTITPEIILQEILCYADNDVYVANMSVLQKRLVENEDPKSVIRDALELSGFNGGSRLLHAVLIIVSPFLTPPP